MLLTVHHVFKSAVVMYIILNLTEGVNFHFSHTMALHNMDFVYTHTLHICMNACFSVLNKQQMCFSISFTLYMYLLSFCLNVCIRHRYKVWCIDWL